MKFNLQIKLIFWVVAIVGLVLTALLFQSVSRERRVFQTSFEEKAEIIALALDANIGSLEELENVSRLQSNIYKFMWLYPELVKISISVPHTENLKIIASSKTEEIGGPTGPGGLTVYEQGETLTKTLVLSDGAQVFNAIAPIRVGGIRVGTYDICLSQEVVERTTAQRQKEVTMTILISIAIIIFSLSFLLRKMIIAPISKIKKGLNVIKKGDLSYRIALKSKDEIGDMARGVNEMTEKLEESYRDLEEKVKERTIELEEAKKSLEIKVLNRTRELKDLNVSLDAQVKERTKDLQERLEELEKFRKLTVGRELRMAVLKEEIAKLKEELKKYEPS